MNKSPQAEKLGPVSPPDSKVDDSRTKLQRTTRQPPEVLNSESVAMSRAANRLRRNPKRSCTAVTYVETFEDDEVTRQDSIQDDDPEFDTAARAAETKFRHPKKLKKPKIAEHFDLMSPKLPEELRLMIIQGIVTNGGEVNLYPVNLRVFSLRCSLRQRPRRNFYQNVNLIRASKKTYSLAVDFIYTKQSFVFSRLDVLQTFLLPMRPETLARLRKVKARVGRCEWQLMPVMSSLMCPMRYLESLELTDLNDITSSRCIGRYLRLTGRQNMPVKLDTFDKIMGIKFARDIYPLMYPLFNHVNRAEPTEAEVNQAESEISREAIRTAPEEGSPTPYEQIVISFDEKAAPRPIVDITRLLQILTFAEHGSLSNKRHSRGWLMSLESRSLYKKFERFAQMPMTDSRLAVRRKATAEEIMRFMARDSY